MITQKTLKVTKTKTWEPIDTKLLAKQTKIA